MASTNWWGEVLVENNKYWELNMSTIHFILKQQTQSLIAYWKYADFDCLQTSFGPKDLITQKLTDYNEARIVGNQSHTWNIKVALPNKNIVVKLLKPAIIEPQATVTIFVSIPLFIQIGNAKEEALDIPLQQLHETWFGSHPTKGEICYITKSTAVHNFNELNIRPFRAFTEIKLTNRNDSFLKIEKLKIPVEYLTLFLNENNVFITDSVLVLTHSDPNQSETEFTKKPCPLFPSSKLISKPRRDIKGINKIITSLL